MGPAAELDKMKDALAPLGAKFWETEPGGLWNDECGTSASWGSDTHVTICPYFIVPEGKMGQFKSEFNNFYAGVRTGTETCMYYGFGVHGQQVFCREGYRSAQGALAHIGDVKESLDKALAIVGDGGLDLSVMGPAAELEQMKEALAPLGCKFWELDEGGLLK